MGCYLTFWCTWCACGRQKSLVYHKNRTKISKGSVFLSSACLPCFVAYFLFLFYFFLLTDDAVMIIKNRLDDDYDDNYE